MVSDGFGNTWESYGGMSPLSLVVARPEIFRRTLDVIAPIVQGQKEGVEVWPQSN